MPCGNMFSSLLSIAKAQKVVLIKWPRLEARLCVVFVNVPCEVTTQSRAELRTPLLKCIFNVHDIIKQGEIKYNFLLIN